MSVEAAGADDVCAADSSADQQHPVAGDDVDADRGVAACTHSHERKQTTQKSRPERFLYQHQIFCLQPSQKDAACAR